MERIVFPIPEICEYLTKETKLNVFKRAERDEQGSKVADFFSRHVDMFNEMKWQKKLRSKSSFSKLGKFAYLSSLYLVFIAFSHKTPTKSFSHLY